MEITAAWASAYSHASSEDAVLGALWLAPGEAGAGAGAAQPAVRLGSLALSSDPSDCRGLAVAPGLGLSALSLQPDRANAAVAVVFFRSGIHDSLVLWPVFASSQAEAGGEVAFTSLALAPEPAAAVTGASGPGARASSACRASEPAVVNPAYVIAPDPAWAVSLAGEALVLTWDMAVRRLTLSLRSANLSLGERSGVYNETCAAWSADCLLAFEDSFSVIWGTTQAGLSLATRAVILSLGER